MRTQGSPGAARWATSATSATRAVALIAAVAASAGCRDREASAPDGAARPRGERAAASGRRAALPAHVQHDTLAAAVAALITPSTRLLGLGELHARVDRPEAPSTLARFTRELVPALPARTSDLVLETWTVDPRCAKVAAATTAKLEAATRRPEATRSELGILVDTSRVQGIRAHRMRVTCEDFQTMAAGDGGNDAIIHMLDLTTAELARLSVALLSRQSASPARAPTPTPPPLVVIYGGALHNDRFPTAGLEPWSYAALVESASERTYLEIDLVVPELVDGDGALAAQPWAPLVGTSDRVVTYRRGERSYVVILPRTHATKPE